MFKKEKFFLKKSDVFLIINASVLIAIFYNFKVIESEILAAIVDNSIAKFVVVFAKIIAVTLVLSSLLLVCSFSKILLKSFLIVIFFISTAYLYVLNKFGTVLDGAMIANALESTGHVEEVIDSSLAIYFFAFAFLPSLLVYFFKITSEKPRKKIIIIAVNLLIIALLQAVFFKDKILKTAFSQYSPPSYFVAIYEYFWRFHNQLQQAKDRRSLTEFYQFNNPKLPQEFNVILIIGESLRADHLGLNGYQRNTTPNLEQIPDLLNFVVTSNFNTTTRAVTSMLSHRNKDQFVDIPPEKSAVDVFRKLGFKTYWYSSQSSKEFHNGMLNIMASEADDYFFRDRLQSKFHTAKIYDESLTPSLAEILQRGGNNFVVLHSFGSHVRFHERYPQNFAKYKPECQLLPDKCPPQEVNNSYDNSVLYTDHVVSRAIQELQGTNSILFFVADHGIFLGENGVYANGGKVDANNDAVTKVPMFFYMTDALRNDQFFAQKFTNAASKIGDKNLSHDNVFDSLFDCAGIESPLFQRSQSICQNQR